MKLEEKDEIIQSYPHYIYDFVVFFISMQVKLNGFHPGKNGT